MIVFLKTFIGILKNILILKFFVDIREGSYYVDKELFKKVKHG